MSNDSVPNLRLVAWGVASAVVGGILHLGYRTHSAGWMLGAAMLILAACILLTVLLTARNLRRLNRELLEEAIGIADEGSYLGSDGAGGNDGAD